MAKTCTNNIRHLGRVFTDDNGVLWCGQSGTGVEFIASTNCCINLVGDNIMPEPNHKNARLGIYINGKIINDIMMNDNASTKKSIFINIEKESVVKIIKLSEGQYSSFGIESIKSDKPISPTTSKNLKIEFVGDSIVCGYGIECKTLEDDCSTNIENFSKAYAYKLSDKLNADYSVMAVSGIGAVSAHTENRKIVDRLMKDSYENYGVSDSRFAGKINPQEMPWDFSKFKPDIIIVNLGTNDESYTKTSRRKQKAFIDAYLELLKQIRKINTEAYIICTYGTMNKTLTSAIETAVNLQKQSDDKISYVHLPIQDEVNDGIVINGHPSEKTNDKVTEILYDFIVSNNLN